ncbi:endonuclease/exonuclease/phosphatase family protein [Arthrobacter celericrescens]|uniref:endonuclease/exonuclease/phosphatase family protein n=1 Tax=Arthrobacter celericrescens TaxID=2320851 RepID=UPI0013C48698|nr:endonuclease/exonuclease/phosphatase family protein [Arthrobacter celericrescens]
MTLDARGKPRSRRRTVFVLALLAAFPVAVLSLFRALPVEWPTPVVQMLAFTPWMVLPAALAAGLGLLSRRRWLGAVAALLLLAQLFWLFPLDFARSLPRAADAVELPVMSFNSEYGQADAAEVVRLVRENGVKLLAVQEHSAAFEAALERAGVAGLLPHRISSPTADAAGSAVYSVYPLEALGLLPDTPFHMPTVRVAAAGGGRSASFEVTNVHTLPPVDTRIAQWRHDLAAVGRVGAKPGHRVLMGDFNASYDHLEFRQLLDGPVAAGTDGRRLVDAGIANNSRLIPTWPMEGMVLPGVVLDHLVTTPEIIAAGYSVHRVRGSDHAAVIAILAIPAG